MDADDRSSTGDREAEEIPLGQRFFERPFLLLFLGVFIMAVFYTGWGLWEILTLPPAPLP
jgi:hypothetical protein